MKNLILGIAVLGLAIACKNTDNASISDSAVVEAPAAACPGAESDQACDMADGEACDMNAAGCEGDAPACCTKGQEGAQVCPATGQEVEN